MCGEKTTGTVINTSPGTHWCVWWTSVSKTEVFVVVCVAVCVCVCKDVVVVHELEYRSVAFRID